MKVLQVLGAAIVIGLVARLLIVSIHTLEAFRP